MNDRKKTKQQLIDELQQLRQQVSESQQTADGQHQTATLAQPDNELTQRLEARIIELQASEARNRALIENASGAIVVTDARGQIVQINAKVEQLFGYPRDELLGQSIELLVPERLRNDHITQRNDYMASPSNRPMGLDLNLYARRKDGSTFPADISLSVIEAEDGPLIVSFVFDVTDRKRAERQLHETETRYRMLVEYTPAINYVELVDNRAASSPHYTNAYVSPQIEPILGYAPAAFQNTPDLWNSLTHPDDQALVQAASAQHYKSGEALDIEYRMLAHDGRVIWFHNRATIVNDENGQPLYSQGILLDITTNKQIEAALRKSEERFRLLLDSSPQGIVLYNTEGKVTYLNPGFTQIFGWTQDELLGKQIDFVPEENWPETRQALQELLEKGKASQAETRRYTKDRRLLDVQGSGAVLYDDAGNPTGSAVFFNDITESKATEAALRSANETLAKQTTELEDRNLQLQAASEVARDAATAHDLRDLLNRVVNIVRERFGFYHAGLFLVDTRREYAILRAATGEAGRDMLNNRHRLKVGEVGIVGYVTDTGKPRIALNVGEDTTHFKNPFLPKTRSEMALPLIVGGEVIGALDVQSEQENAFTQDDITILQVMADQVATAIENTRLFEQNQQALYELERRYGEQTRQSWQQRLTDRAVAYNYDRFGIDPVSPSTDSPPDSAQPDAALALDNGKKALKASISLRGQSIGDIYLQRDEDQPPWTPEEQALVSDVATQVALALENARLVEETRSALSETQRLADRDRLISQLTDKIHRQVDIQSILETATAELRRATGRKRAIVRLELPGRGEDAQ